MQTSKNNVFTNLIWRFAERCGAQIVQLIVSIVLARLLAPEDYGLIAIVLVFTNILQVFVDSGLGNALIQKKDADDLDFSSVFIFNIAMCVVLYMILFFTAPFVASFYKQPALTTITRVLGLSLIISGLKNVQQAHISRNLQFKKFFFAAIGGTVFSAIAGIAMALGGFGIWALVVQKLLSLLVNTIILWVVVEWKPKFIFAWNRLKGLISFGWKLLASSLLDTLYRDIRTLIIGKMYSEADLAYYNQGNQFPNIIVANVNLSIDSIMLPVLSQEQDNTERMKSMMRRAIKVGIYIMAPLMMGLAFTAENVVSLLLTDKWLPCVPFMRIFCITYMFYPLHTTNLNAIKAKGRSDLTLKLEIAKKIVGMILLLSSMWFGVMAMAYSLLINSLCSQIINTYPNKKLLKYSYFEQLKDILPSIMLAVFMGICVHFISYSNFPAMIELGFQVLLGAGIYVGGSVVTRNESFLYLLDILKSFLTKKGKGAQK